MKIRAGAILAAWGVAVFLCAGPLGAGEDDLSGVYACEGKGYDGGVYQGTVVIRKQGQAYALAWKIGTQAYLGIALREGDVLSSTWTMGETLNGIVVYKIRPNRQLAGRYSDFGGQIGTENLTFINEGSGTSRDPAAAGTTL